MSRRLTHSLLLGYLLAVGGCASAGGGTPVARISPTECAALAAGRLPDGRSIAQAYDSLYVLAKERPTLGVDDFVLVPVTRRAQLINQRMLAARMQSSYPLRLLRGGQGGRTRVAFLIGPNGRTFNSQLVRSSGDPTLDAVTLEAVNLMEFTPAQNGDCVVPMFVSMPITWLAR